MSRVERDEPHAFPHPREDTLDHGVANFAMRGMSPPDENVGFVEHAFSQAMLPLLQSGGTDFERPIFSNALGDCGVHAMRINFPDERVFAFMHILAPDSDANPIRHSRRKGVSGTQESRNFFLIRKPGSQESECMRASLQSHSIFPHFLIHLFKSRIAEC